MCATKLHESSSRSGAHGRADEFERLYRESYRRVYNFVYGRMLNRADAEDITSEAFLKAARAFDRFDPTRASFTTWVIAIARNCAASQLRRGHPEVTAADTWVDPDAASTTDDYPSLGSDAQLAEALLTVLGEDERELVRLKFYEGMQNKQIGELLGMNPSTVGTRLHRAVARMRAAAEGMGL